MICEGEGPEECITVYESICETSYHEHNVEDDVVDCVEEYEEKCVDVTQGMLKDIGRYPYLWIKSLKANTYSSRIITIMFNYKLKLQSRIIIIFVFIKYMHQY